jgi:hypothetical protein
MSASTMTYTLNHHTVYFLEFRKGALALVSRYTEIDNGEFEHLIRVSVDEDPEKSAAYGEPRFRIQVSYPERIGDRDKFVFFPMSAPQSMVRKQIGHGVQGQAIVDIGPTVVILNVTSNVGSYFNDFEFAPDNAECR